VTASAIGCRCGDLEGDVGEGRVWLGYDCGADSPSSEVISDFSNSQTLEGDIAPTPTPEPATLILLGSTMAGLGAVIRKRRLR
jgi:hypothetical protein